jgi:hypothetical protein
MSNGHSPTSSGHQLFEECAFEVSPFASKLTGTIRAAVYEEGGTEPTTIIQVDQAWHVDVEWTLRGHMRRHLCGQWCVMVHLESIGRGKEYSLPEQCEYFPIDPCNDGTYRKQIQVPAGKIDPKDCGTLYLLAVTLVSLDACGRPGHIAAYCKGPNLMFYEASDESN